MGYAEVLYEVKDRIATVTLHRPDKLNAWTAQMGREVRGAMTEAARDEAVRVIVLTGAGRGFCAGADMGLLAGLSGAGAPTEDAAEVLRRERDEAAAGTAADARPDFRGPHAYFPTIPKPIIGALNGATAGLGLVVALYCDLRLASDAAVFTTASPIMDSSGRASTLGLSRKKWWGESMWVPACTVISTMLDTKPLSSHRTMGRDLK